MTDARVRELERRWRTTGDVEDGATFLREALRAGRLSPERARLAAHLEEPAAGGAPPDGLPGWVAGLAPWGRLLCVRAVLAGVERALATTPGVDALRPDVAHLHAWVADPRWKRLDAWARRCARAGPHRLANGAPRELAAAVHLAARAAVEEDFAVAAAAATRRLQQILGAATLRPLLLDLVRREALGG